MSTSASEARKAEMARLFYLFEKLKSRRARPSSAINEDAPMEDVRPTLISVPDPATKKISTIVDKSQTSTRPRRNTVTSIIARGGSDMPTDEGHSDSDAESLAKFPLAERKRFPFTFKHMVHKLYEKDDWAKTVKEMLEKSQNEFKPLAEQQAAVIEEDKDKRNSMDEEGDETMKDGMVRFKIVTSPGGGKRANLGGRQRCQSIATTGGRGHTPLSSGIRSPGFKSPGFKSPVIMSPGPGMRSPGVEGKPDLRALKKRCVGRRKSASGPLNGEGGKLAGNPRGSWVYSSAISASERPVATPFVAFPPAPPPSPTGGKGPSSNQALGAKTLPSKMQGGTGMKRRVIPATDRPVATTFAAFPPRPPPSPIGGKGSSANYQPLGMKNIPSTMQGRGSGMKRRVVPATDRRVATSFAAFPPGPLPSPTGAKGTLSKYQPLGTNKLPNTLKERGAPTNRKVIPATDHPVATTFGAFPPGPPPSPTGAKGSLSKYQALSTKNLPSTLKEREGAGTNRRVSGGGEPMVSVPLMMPLQQVTNTNANGLAARRRSRMSSKTDDEKGAEQNIEQRSPVNQTFAN